MRNRNMVKVLKNFLVRQVFSDEKRSESYTGSLTTRGRTSNRPPGSIHVVNGCDFGDGEYQATMCVEISSSKIVTVIGSLNMKGQVEILGVGEQRLKDAQRGLSYNVMKIARAIRSSVADAMEMSGLQNLADVCSNYSGPLFIKSLIEILIKDDTRQEIVERDIERLQELMYMMISPPGEEVILIQPEHYTIDDIPRIVDPVGMTGKRIEGYFRSVAGNVQILKVVDRCIGQADLSLKAIYPNILASAEAVLLDEEKEGSIAVIDIGASTTHLAVFKDGVLIHAETIQLGGSAITRDIQHFTGLTFEKSELLKLNYSRFHAAEVSDDAVIYVDQFNGRRRMAIRTRELGSVVEARMEELISLAYGKILASLDDSEPGLGIVLAGAGIALFPGIEELVRRVTGSRCCVGHPDLYLTPNEKLGKGLVNKLESPRYATCIGLLKLTLKSRNP